jgi:hypothetical protein
LALLLACGALRGGAQRPADAVRSVLLTTAFRTSMSYEKAIERLDQYYQEQIGRKGAEALAEIGPRRHYEVWHDMWVFFDPSGDQTLVTIKRPSESATTRVVKGWMLEIAGRVEGDLPLTFREEPPLGTIEMDLYASRKDIAGALAAQAGMRPLASWQQLGLFVLSSPLTSVVLAPVGLHGVHHLTVKAEDAAAGKQIVAKLVQATAGPRVCAAFSESTELAAEIQKAAQDKRDEIAIRSAGIMSPTGLDLKLIEDRIRSDPAMQKRIAAAGSLQCPVPGGGGLPQDRDELDRAHGLFENGRQVRGGARAGAGFDSERAQAGRTGHPAHRAGPHGTARYWRLPRASGWREIDRRVFGNRRAHLLV